MKVLTAKNIDMTQGSIAKSLIMYSIPIIISDFLQQMYNVVDSIIVGKMIGKVALAAVGETFFITNIFLGFFIGVSLGATVAISKYFGARNKKKIASALDATLKLSILFCVLFTILGVVLVDPLLRLVGTTAEAYSQAKTYLTIYFAGISSQLLYNMFSSVLKAIGDSQRPLYVLAFTAALNIILDFIFVGPMEMGVAGAAYATIISQIISDVILLVILIRTPVFEKPFIRLHSFDWKVVKEIIVIGFPYSLQRTIISLSNTIVISYVNRCGVVWMAAWTSFQKIDQFVISCIISLSSALTSFVAQNVGAKKEERIRKGIKIGFWMITLISVFYAIIAFIFRYPLITLFNDDAEVVELGAKLITVVLTVHITNNVVQVLAGALRGVGKSFWPTMILLFSYVLCRQVYLRLRWPSYQNPMVVVASYHFTWVLAAIIIFIYYKLVMRKLYDLIK